ncbi:MAG: envelope stress response membrane protein PspB [Gammaproteobacteria bacterium]
MDAFEFVTSILGMVLFFITIWIILLRAGRRKQQPTMEPGSSYELGELSAMADSLKERIDILESILDAEVPDWREQHGNGTE